MVFELPSLPFEKDALSPYMSAQTFDFHHGKHHKAYVDNTNKLVEGTPHASKSLEELIMAAWKDSNTGLFNNAAQIWNHSFFWNCLKPSGGGIPSGELVDKIKSAFGSFENFKEEFKKAGVSQFGSGWVWLIAEKGDLKITKTPNAELPMVYGQTAILTCDVWEHAYYLDYQNRRPDFLTTYLDHLVNWDFATSNLSKALM